jgi:hypothetical protein
LASSGTSFAIDESKLSWEENFYMKVTISFKSMPWLSYSAAYVLPNEEHKRLMEDYSKYCRSSNPASGIYTQIISEGGVSKEDRLVLNFEKIRAIEKKSH